jgi:hypothetical protein
MYRQGLGDCFLLTFFTGPAPIHVLVDCGTLGATTTGVKIKEVAQNIAAVTGNHLDLLVVTHEHKDHVSGFGSAQDVFDAITVDRVWVAWTENPADPDAQDIAKYEQDLLDAVGLTSNALAANQAAAPDERTALHDIAAGARELLGFVGDVPDGGAPLGADFAKTVHAAMSYASMKAGTLPAFLDPGDVIAPSWAPGVRFYVLGPPRQEGAIGNLGGHDSPELYHVTAQLASALGGSARFGASPQAFGEYREGLGPADRQAFERALPFDSRFRIESGDERARKAHMAAYDDPQTAWRRIDYDWLAGADDLALQLDNATNNTSLVLAVELVADGRVLLMAADAQLGNWLSWDDVVFQVPQPNGTTKEVRSEDLLGRTVFYKVGHHSSHNATINERGLELMQRDDLVAMIPVDRQVALGKSPPWQMPAKALYTRLLEKTRGRVLRSDTGWPRNDERPPLVTQAEWDAARATPDIVIDDLFIDFMIQ